jgi:hypothetical protein
MRRFSITTACVEQFVQELSVQEFVVEPTVEALDSGVLRWRTRLDEHRGGGVEPAPVRHRCRNELRT